MNLDAGEVLLYSGDLITSADEAARREDEVRCVRRHVLAFIGASTTMNCKHGSSEREKLASQLPCDH